MCTQHPIIRCVTKISPECSCAIPNGHDGFVQANCTTKLSNRNARVTHCLIHRLHGFMIINSLFVINIHINITLEIDVVVSNRSIKYEEQYNERPHIFISYSVH